MEKRMILKSSPWVLFNFEILIYFSFVFASLAEDSQERRDENTGRGHLDIYFGCGHCGLSNSMVVGVAKSLLPGSFPFGCFALGNIKHLPRANS